MKKFTYHLAGNILVTQLINKLFKVVPAFMPGINARNLYPGYMIPK
jgi:hypothetical protein